MSDKRDEFGDRMKAYEDVETLRRLDVALPVYARIDGRCFSKFTRGCAKPFDGSLHRAMIDTTKALVRETHARIGYTQSDEISLVWLAEGEGSSIFFDGKVLKMASVLAGMSSAYFALAIRERGFGADFEARAPHFDCRVFQLPSRTESANAILWREMDATKNAIQMATQVHFSPKKLHGKSGAEMIEMLAETGIDFANYPAWARHGTFVRRVVVNREMTADELARIPEKHRPKPGTLIDRTEVVAFNPPSFRTVTNREGVIFDGETPIEAIA